MIRIGHYNIGMESIISLHIGCIANLLTKTLLLLKLISLTSESYAADVLENNSPSCKPLLSENEQCLTDSFKRYLLYEVNPGEGFNLRRDVYIRIAPLVDSLNHADKSSTWVLVLPPWGMLPHWKNSDSNTYLDWGTFFDLNEIRKYIPVLEYTEYLEEYGMDNNIDIIYQLQHFPFNKSETWSEKIDSNVKCESRTRYRRDAATGLYRGNFWNHDVFAKQAACMALRGHSSTLSNWLLKSNNIRTILFDKAEVILWDNYGGTSWWTARKSLVFAKHLTKISQDFLSISNFTPSKPPQKGNNKAPFEYIAVHLRRSDFLYGGRKMPTIEGAALQIVKLMSSLHLSNIFIATDATEEEKDQFGQHVTDLSKPTVSNLRIVTNHCPVYMTEGECAIVDQILCSLSSYFIGTEDSTFTFRIFEEREIMGFDPVSNFNYLCSDDSSNCKKATQWRIM